MEARAHQPCLETPHPHPLILRYYANLLIFKEYITKDQAWTWSFSICDLGCVVTVLGCFVCIQEYKYAFPMLDYGQEKKNQRIQRNQVFFVKKKCINIISRHLLYTNQEGIMRSTFFSSY